MMSNKINTLKECSFTTLSHTYLKDNYHNGRREDGIE
jgi:hypothetical protein